ncbi:MAG: hypothetical protein FLDDKLPJ_03608 [Phycisphaerae bacterium]|nr:hypothetical protein [Phycisphaerae bacterium]
MIVLKPSKVLGKFSLCGHAIVWGLAMAAVWRWECVCCVFRSSFEFLVSLVVLMSVTAVPVAVYYRRLTFVKAVLFAIAYGLAVFFFDLLAATLAYEFELAYGEAGSLFGRFGMRAWWIYEGAILVAMGPGIVCVLMCRVILGKVVLQNGMMCPGCGHTLLGTSGRVCPECGRGFGLHEL